MKKKLTGLLAAVAMCFAACVKDKPPVTKTVILPGGAQSDGVFIVNEGTFNFGNAGVGYYRFSDGSVTEDLFQPTNNRKLGDVCQSMCRFNDRIYVVVNNSAKIEVVNPSSFLSVGKISGLPSPRYFLGVNVNKAYVSDFKSNQIAVVDLNTLSVVKTIPCPGWAEEMALVFGKAYITNLRSNYLYVAQTDTDVLTDSILVGYGSSSIKQDRFGKLWVSTTGNDNTGEQPALVQVNPLTHEVERRIEFTSSPSNLSFNGSCDTLFFLNNDVYKLAVETETAQPISAITADGRNIYGFGVDLNNGDLYLADALDFVQRGMVYRYSSAGALVTSFKVGYIPSRFYFY